MSDNSPNLIFFTPTLQKTGSELVLFNLLRHLPQTCNAVVISKYKGVLFDDIPSGVKKNYLFETAKPSGLLDRVMRRFFPGVLLDNKLQSYKNAVWYINTIVMPDILEYAVKNKIRVILHVHELEQMYKLLSEQQISHVCTYPELIITNSNASREVLLKLGSKADIKICFPSVDYARFNYNKEKYLIWRRKLGITNEFVWVMSGSFDENKNPKLFIDITVMLKQSGLPFVMLWIGIVTGDNKTVLLYKKYAEERGVAGNIIWIENTPDYFEHLNCSDGFVLTSRLESFSLVTVEALHLGLPIVANNCRGVNEILQKEYGVVIDGENAVEMAKEMVTIMKTESSRKIEKGKAIANRFDMNKIKNVWLGYINKYIA